MMNYLTFPRAALYFVLVCLLFLSIINPVFAQQNAGAGISPALFEQAAEPGESLTTEITVSNLSDREQVFFLFVRDIVGVLDNGTPVYAQPDAETTGYEMSEWVALAEAEVVLAPYQDYTVPVVITVPPEASPGSHFGGIFVSAEPPKLRTIGAGVGYEVANIVSVRVAGDVIDNAQIRTFSTDSLIYSEPTVEFMARIENKGNVLIRPYGPLVVKNMFGDRVATLTFNESLGGVFPRTIRDFDMLWEDEGTAFGRYVAELSLVYEVDGINQKTIYSETSFWVLPMKIIKPAAIAIAIILAAVYFSIKMYVRRRLGTVSRGRRINSRRSQRGTPVLFLVLVVSLVITTLFLLGLLLLFA